MTKANVKYMMIRYFFKGYEALYEEMKMKKQLNTLKKH